MSEPLHPFRGDAGGTPCRCVECVPREQVSRWRRIAFRSLLTAAALNSGYLLSQIATKIFSPCRIFSPCSSEDSDSARPRQGTTTVNASLRCSGTHLDSSGAASTIVWQYQFDWPAYPVTDATFSPIFTSSSVWASGWSSHVELRGVTASFYATAPSTSASENVSCTALVDDKGHSYEVKLRPLHG